MKTKKNNPASMDKKNTLLLKELRHAKKTTAFWSYKEKDPERSALWSAISEGIQSAVSAVETLEKYKKL